MDKKMVAKFPDIYLITGDYSSPDYFLQNLKNCFRKGIFLAQMRVKNIALEEYKSLAQKAITISKGFNTNLLLNADISIVQKLDADGVHLTSEALFRCASRPLDKSKIVAASCHNQKELEHARKIDVDFVTLSLVLPTLTHPGMPHLGWNQFRKLTEISNLPVYALGGMKQTDIETAKEKGAIGVAGIREFWSDSKS